MALTAFGGSSPSPSAKNGDDSGIKIRILGELIEGDDSNVGSNPIHPYQYFGGEKMLSGFRKYNLGNTEGSSVR